MKAQCSLNATTRGDMRDFGDDKRLVGVVREAVVFAGERMVKMVIIFGGAFVIRLSPMYSKNANGL